MKPTASKIVPLLFLGVTLAQEGGVDPYAPDYVECPSDLKVRSAKDGLSDAEQSWRRRRGEKIIGSLASYLRTANIEGLDVENFVNDLGNDDYPVIGLSISGGGTQSGFGGLGIWQAFDDRYPPAVQAGTGGLTQLLSYITGLSGGGCVAVATIAANDFKSVEEMNQNVNYTVDYTAGPSGNQSEFIEGIFENVGAKAEAGFPISVTDAFGQFWANYIPEDWMFKNYSEIASNGSVFSEGEGPMPIIVLTEVIPGESPEIGNIMYPGNNDTNGFSITSYEVTPLEFGSWAGGRIQAFIDTKYLGTSMSNGSAANSSECARGFDKFTFIQGSTANAYPAWFIDSFYDIPIFAKRGLEARQDGGSNDITIPPDQEDNPLVQLVNGTASAFNQTFNQSMWATYPNPFQGFNVAMENVDELLLLDGSLTGETNPIRPLIIPEREVDFVIVYEASSDAAPYNWVNGTNLINTARSAAQGNIPFPVIPDVATLVTQNLTKQPTFFGCGLNTSVPLVLYLPNSPWSGFSNYSYLQSQFTENQLNVTWENAFNLATYGNGTIEPDWPQCLACAAIRGTLRRARRAEPNKCTECFQRHCWNGVRANRTVTDADLDPKLRLDPGLSYQEWNDTVWSKGIEEGSGGGGGNGSDGGSGGGSGGDGGSGSGGGDSNGGNGGGSGGGNGSGASMTGERLFGLTGHLPWMALVLCLQGVFGL